MKTRIGISGWVYPPWRGKFYPKEITQKNELRYASSQLGSIEINGSFYALQSPKSYQKWFDETPEDFVFSVKGPRYITHIRRLKEPELLLANFFGSGVLHLKQKLGPILWQLPPQFNYDEERLDTFLSLLPQTVGTAAKLSKKADRLEPDFPKESANSKTILRHAMEVRSHTFENPDFIALLRKYNVALVIADTAGKWPYMEDITSDFLYLRLHGDEAIYSSGYTEEGLKLWAERISLWRAGKSPKNSLTISDDKARAGSKDCFVYFDNDQKVRSPHDAIRLAELLKS